MLVVRNYFVSKPGQASQFAAQLKSTIAAVQMPRARVLTDLTGDFNRVVLEYEVDNLAGFEAQMQQYSKDPKFREQMKGYTDMWLSGSREILQTS